jgi:hypothetical protein
MKKLFAACCAAFLLVVIVAPLAHAATEVNVRIEGKEATLFEKTIPVAIHPIEAFSDTQQRSCDGVNQLDPENVVPGITPTLASAEAMESIGESFDGEWYDGFGDYFITRWGPDEQSNVLGAYWGVLVNEILTSVGGCQYQLNQNDEVLWLWNAFPATPRPLLALFPEVANYTEGARPTRVTVAPGEPVPLEVVAYPAGGEGVAAETPSRTGAEPFMGADVSPVEVSAKGFQRVDTASSETVVSGAGGKATASYATPGLYRIKATVGAPGMTESVARSNGLEICVETEARECDPGTPGGGETPAGGETPGGGSPGSGSGTPGGGSSETPATDASAATAPSGPAATASVAPVQTVSPSPAPVRIGKPRLGRSGLASGRLQLSWAVLDPGAGVKSWQISARSLGKKGGWVSRARGTTQTGATVRLPRGHRYQLRLTVTDLSGHTTTYGLGKVAVPGVGRG